MTPLNLTPTPPPTLDQQSWASQNATSDEQASPEQSFGGVLSKLQGETSPPSSGDATSAKPQSASTAPGAAIQPTLAWTVAGARLAQVAALEIAQSAGTGASDKADAPVSSATGRGKSDKDAGASDDASDPTDATPTSAVAGPSLDLFSMFGITPGQSASSPARASGTASAGGSAGTVAAKPVEQDGAESEPEVTLASDITTVSHLAPAAVLSAVQPSAAASTPGKSAAIAKVDPAKRSGPAVAGSAAQAETVSARQTKDATTTSPVTASSVSKSLTAAKADTDSTATPGSMQAPIQAIAEAVTQLASAQADVSETRAAGGAAASSSVSVPTETSPSLAPARTMTLQLTPSDLGSVSVRLHMVGDSLDVSLGVSSQQTLGLLTREQDSLSSALSGQSYQLNSLVIQGADSMAGSSGGNNASHGDGGGQSRSNGDSGNSGARDPNGSPRQQSGGRQDSAASTSAGTGDAQLYV